MNDKEETESELTTIPAPPPSFSNYEPEPDYPEE